MKHTLIAVLAAVAMFVPSQGRADVVIGSSGSWQTGVAASNANTPYWDNASGEGASCNVGFWLEGAATDCTNTNGVGPAVSGFPPGIAPGVIPYWANADGSATSNLYFESSNPGNSVPTTLRLTLAGARGINKFGWYDQTTGAMTELINPANISAGLGAVSIDFIPTAYYGFYLTDLNGFTYYTESSRNTDGTPDQRFALFRQTPNNPLNDASADIFWLGVEDEPLNGNRLQTAGDKDYNDLVIQITAVPEPSTYLSLGLMLTGVLYGYRRRKQ